MRSLASIQRVAELSPIEGADRIEMAKILGWQCVVPKRTFRVGDLAVYFEIDSFLPEREEFEFLRAGSFVSSPVLGDGFRIKTKKFRGQISQGLVLTTTILPDDINIFEGMDVTELLGVKKWEIPERATTGGTIIGQLPAGVPHTDETRVQAEPDLIEEFAGKKYYISTKMDGSSHSVSIDQNGFHVTGHNFEYKDDGKSSFYELVKTRNLEYKMRAFMIVHQLDALTIQGELCAPGIQKNRLKLTAPEWYVFTMEFDGKRIGLEEMRSAAVELGLTTVPIEEIGENLPSRYESVEDILKRADGEYPNGGPKEGIVIRTVEPEYSKTIDGYLSMKVVSNKYLLKNE